MLLDQGGVAVTGEETLVQIPIHPQSHSLTLSHLLSLSRSYLTRLVWRKEVITFALSFLKEGRD